MSDVAAGAGVRWLSLKGRPKTVHGVVEGSSRAVCGAAPGWWHPGRWLGAGDVVEVKPVRCSRCVRILASARRRAGG